MKEISRRRFLGGVAGLSAFSLVPERLLSAPGTEHHPQAAAQPCPEFSALKLITEKLAAWGKEGQQFAGDKLKPDAEAEWGRLIDFYFPQPAQCEKLPLPRCISVNAANLCPSLRYVDEMVSLIQKILACDISFPLRGELAEASQARAADVIKTWIGLGASNCSPQCLLALTRNTTEGNNIINNGLIVSGFLNARDPANHNIVIWDMNHPTNLEAWLYRQATQLHPIPFWGPRSIRTIKTNMFAQSPQGDRTLPSDPRSLTDVLSAFDKAIDRNTRVLSISWQSNDCGMLLPMPEIVGLVRSKEKEYGSRIHIHADSAQTFGVLDLRLDQIAVDSIAGSFHKWPCGPKMVGLIYMNEQSTATRFLPGCWGYDEYIKTPADYGFDPEQGQIDPDAKRFAYLGQQNDATLVATWATALFHTGHFHPNVSPGVIEKRIRYLGDVALDALYKKLGKIFPHFRPDTAYQYISTPTSESAFRSSVVLFKVPEGISPGDVTKNVYHQHCFAIANLNGMLRIAPGFNNTAQEVQGAVEATIEVIKAMQAGKLPNRTHLREYV